MRTERVFGAHVATRRLETMNRDDPLRAIVGMGAMWLLYALPALFLGLAGPGLATVPGHSPELCSLHESLFGNSNGARRTITPTELD